MNIAFIPLRGGSKGIPNKNIRKIAGKPLCAWALEAALDAKVFSRVVVSTDSQHIAGVVAQISDRIDIINRPPHLATDTAPTEGAMLHAASILDFDVITTIQATSPLTRAQDFELAMKKYFDGGYDSMLTAVRDRGFFWTLQKRPVNYNPTKRPMRQDHDGWYRENGAFYVTSRVILESAGCRIGGRVGIYEMSPETRVEIDDMNDWIIVERLLETQT